MIQHLHPGEVFATTDPDGRVLVWRVEDSGMVKLQPTSDTRFPAEVSK